MICKIEGKADQDAGGPCGHGVVSGQVGAWRVGLGVVWQKCARVGVAEWWVCEDWAAGWCAYGLYCDTDYFA